MAKPRRSRRTVTILVVLVLVSITVITLDETGKLHGFTSGLRTVASDIFNPFRRGVNGVVDPIGRFFAGAVHYSSLEKQNAQLRQELNTLQHRHDVQVQQTALLTKRLQAEAIAHAITTVSALSSVVAQKTDGATSDFKDTFTIGEGTDDGVSVGDPVLGPATGTGTTGGLVGVVIAAHGSTATVELIETATFTVGVTFGHDQHTTLSGQGAGKPLIAAIVPSQTKITGHPPMVTTNLPGAEFPKNIPVADVLRVTTVPGETQKTLTATPVADLTDLTFVVVVQWGTGS